MSVHVHRSADTGWTKLPNVLLRHPAMSARARGVLVTLLSHEDGWQQSVAFTSREMSDGVYAVRAAIKELVGLGYIVRTRQSRDGGRWTTDLHVYDYPQTLQSTAVGDADIGDADSRSDSSLYVEALDVEPLDEEHQDEEQELSLVPSFDAFWAQYPRKVGKVAAQKAWRNARMSHTTQLLAIAVAANYAMDPNRDPGFTPHPATWLNQGRWMDEAPEPRRGPRSVAFDMADQMEGR